MVSAMELTSVRTAGKALLVILAGLLVRLLVTFYKRRHSLDGLVHCVLNRWLHPLTAPSLSHHSIFYSDTSL